MSINWKYRHYVIFPICMLCGLGGMILPILNREKETLDRPTEIAPARFVANISDVLSEARNRGDSNSRIEHLAERHRLRHIFPLVSIKHKLAYEAGKNHGSWVPIGKSQTESLAAMDAYIENNMDDWRHRSGMLTDLHRQYVEAFVLSKGFGYYRMSVFASEERLREQETQNIDLSDEVKNQTVSLHDVPTLTLKGYIDPWRIGFVAGNGYVAGFSSHRIPDLSRFKVAYIDSARVSNRSMGIPETFRITRLELISLLRHESPCVYVTPLVVELDAVDSRKTREPTFFEQSAIQKMQNGEDLILEDQAGRIVMVGAIRAGNTCLKCHTAAHGALLGAFSYDLAGDTNESFGAIP